MWKKSFLKNRLSAIKAKLKWHWHITIDVTQCSFCKNVVCVWPKFTTYAEKIRNVDTNKNDLDRMNAKNVNYSQKMKRHILTLRYFAMLGLIPSNHKYIDIEYNTFIESIINLIWIFEYWISWLEILNINELNRPEYIWIKKQFSTNNVQVIASDS